MCILMIALVCTAVQEEVLGVRCKLMLHFLQKVQDRIDTESGRSDHFYFLNAKFGVPAEEVEGGVDLSELPQQQEGSPSHDRGGQPADFFDDVPSVSGSEDPPARPAAAAAAAAAEAGYVHRTRSFTAGAQQGASSEDGSR
jgi:hypothetical protein